MAKALKCPCCKQSSRLRKVECVCGNYAMQSRTQIARGLMACPCGGSLEPVCLEDRARCFAGEKYGEDAWAELAYRFPSRPDPVYSARAKKAAQTRKGRAAFAAVRNAAEPCPF